MGQKPELRIAAAPDDMRTVLGFFEATAYEVGQIGPDAFALTAPTDLDERLARREVELYIRALERLYPELDVSIQ
jgi:hypothetical protein